MLSIDSELKAESMSPEIRSVVPSGLVDTSALLKQLRFLEETRIWNLWPTAQTFEDTMTGFFERLADVRAVNKKYIQKRAYYDLLRYFKK